MSAELEMERRAIWAKYQGALDQIRQLENALASCHAQHAATEERADAAEAENARLARERDEARINLDSIMKRGDDLLRRLTAAEAENGRLRRDLDNAVTYRNDYAEKLKATQARLKEVEGENARLREALKPFAEYAKHMNQEQDRTTAILSLWRGPKDWLHVTVADFHRARAALGEQA